MFVFHNILLNKDFCIKYQQVAAIFLSSQHVLGFTYIDAFSIIELHTFFSKCPISFPIISIVKLAKNGFSWENWHK